MVEVQDRKKTRVGAAVGQMIAEVDAVQALAEHLGRQAAHPLVEIAEHELRSADVPIANDRRQPLGLMPPLEDGGPEMHVVNVERAAVHGDIDALKPPRLARLPRQIVLEVLDDRKPAEHGIAELMAAQMARGRHHPPHPEQRAELLRVPAVTRPRTDDFLQRDDVGVDDADQGGGAIGARASIEAAAAMNVVGRDTEGRARRVSHYAMIAAVIRALFVGLAIAACSLQAACARPQAEPLQLEPNRLTVENQSSRNWTGVEIWLNTYYRVTTPSIPAGGRFQVGLDSFVAGFGQRFNYHRMQVNDLRLIAKLPDGQPFELKKQFTAGGLAGMLGGKR